MNDCNKHMLVGWLVLFQTGKQIDLILNKNYITQGGNQKNKENELMPGKLK